MAYFLCACVSFKRPEGPWLYPARVQIDDAIMKETRVGVVCGIGSPNEDSWSPIASSHGCDGLKEIVEQMGASVVEVSKAGSFSTSQDTGGVAGQRNAKGKDGDQQDLATGDDNLADQPDYDFAVAYVSRRSERDFCWGTLPFFVLSLTLLPCVEDLHLGGEIRFLDDDGLDLQKKTFRVTERNVYGVVALYYLARQAYFSDEYRAQSTDLQERFVDYLSDAVYSFRVRQLVSSKREETADGGRL